MTDQNDAPAEAGANAWADAKAAIFGGQKPETAEPAPAGPAETETPPAPEPEPAGEDAGAKPEPSAPAPEPEKDPWADAPEELRTAYQTAKADFEQRLRSEAGRQAALQRELRKLRETAATPAPQAPTADGDPLAAALTGLNGIKDDYPDLVGPILAALGPLAERVQSIDQHTAAAADRAAATVLERFEAAHPDWREVVVGNDDQASFWNWVEDQPRRLRDIAEANRNGWVDASGASELLAAYKQHLGGDSPPPSAPPTAAPETRPDPRRQRQLAAAAAAPTSGRPGVPEPPATGGTALWNQATAWADKRYGS